MSDERPFVRDQARAICDGARRADGWNAVPGLMRIVLAALALAACSGPPTATEVTGAFEPTALMGAYHASSDLARDVTGNVAIERGGLMFDSGAVLYTRVLEPRRGGDRVAQGGESYATLARGGPDLIVELRRVTEQSLRRGAPGLCGEEAPSYVALAYVERATDITLLVFTGAQPPGPQAIDSRLCATLAYAAPDGARTRQGIVLQ
ncbi:MAG: hypothetical protein AB7O98_08555 [Hyphomonadaceae bacterium]